MIKYGDQVKILLGDYEGEIRPVVGTTEARNVKVRAAPRKTLVYYPEHLDFQPLPKA